MDNFSGDKTALQAHRVLLRCGLSLVSAFAWVFVFEYVLQLSGTFADAFLLALLVYGVSQVVLAVLTPISASHLRHGVKRAAIIGACFAALAFAVLGATLAGYFSDPIGWGLVLFGIFFGAYRALYWIPYRLQAARTGSTQSALFELLIALMPAFAGVTLATVFLSSLRLLFGASILMLLSIIPLFFLHDLSERFDWGYTDTFKKLFEARYRTLSSRSMLAGMESTALFVVWPLAVFLIVGRSYLVFGIVMTASLLVLLLARSVYKQLMRAGFSGGSVSLDVIFSVSAWLLRLAAGSPIAIVFVDSYAYVSAPSGAPDFLAREHHCDAGSYLDEFTALQEISMAIGRVLMCIFAGIMLVVLPMSLALAATLILAAVAAGLSAALAHRLKVHAY